MIKPTLRKTMVSNTKNIEVFDRHARHIRNALLCLAYKQTYRWKEKLAILMLPRIQGSL